MITNNANPDFNQLKNDALACRLCAPHLPLGPRPIIQCGPEARVLIASQAPGKTAHLSGVPFDDASGERLRNWMGVDDTTFYDTTKIAILPMGFCYPGTGDSGDLPPRPECAPAWRRALLEAMPNIEFTLAIGRYAQNWHLPQHKKRTLTDTVKAWQEFAPQLAPLPHPSGRNNGWLKKNPWFAEEVVPQLRARISKALAANSGS